ncbi:4-hydroxy-tetrahydrodipicolinate synthase [Gracilibacillus salitolerans]|uniref:4-hydroxy-tetrahydrodipicolinate synthase n=1 Tax=Gracilibacillus salitolerans TaxID=2663022 RepID=A0A5Q2TFD8_9BACI|nr:4-hydroxy-tetrahydrodipicolinate synthase [Gracilibacillus salitolerans]QGH33509.1 4-hydroxy-tetrahydrodipicolinate synthase [Gracilibacillus salitolerans]
MKSPKGIISAMLTPFDENQKIDEEVTRKQVNRLIDNGINGLFILGTNGEFFNMDDKEKVQFSKIVVDEVKGRIPICAGTGAIRTDDVIRLTKKMEDVGVDLVSVITPYLMTISQRELIAHYKAVASSTNLPILIYHMPQGTNNVLKPETVTELSKIPNIVGIKDSSGDFDQILIFIEATEDDFAVYSGADSLILWNLIAGGAGAIAATSNMFPSLVSSIYQNWLNGDIDKAREAQEMLRPIRNASTMASTPAVFKKAMELLGEPVGPARFPVEQVGEDVTEKLRTILKQYN